MNKKTNLNIAIKTEKDFLEFETATLKVRVRPETKSISTGRGRSFEIRDFNKKGRCFVWGAPKPAMDEPPTTVKGEHPGIDREWARFNREEVKLMRVEMFKALRVLGFGATPVEFSKFAGCSCPCSPGFILKNEELRGFNIFVDVKRPVMGLLPAAKTVSLADFDEVIFPEV